MQKRKMNDESHERRWNMMVKVLSLALVMLACGCVRTMDMASFENEVFRHAGQTINSVVYLGTKDNGDYYEHLTLSLFTPSTVRVCPSVLPDYAREPYDGKTRVMVKRHWQLEECVGHFARTGIPVVEVEIYDSLQWHLKGDDE